MSHLAIDYVHQGWNNAKECHLQKLSSGFVPGRNLALSSIPPITERAEVGNKERVVRKYSQV